MGMVINQYEVYLVDLDPTKGHEIQKKRPCLVISPNPDELDKSLRQQFFCAKSVENLL
jgi:mRNA-degrading endonuclease toxin of MazEF toxin-antitoxin module